ncbi:hypothetical protein GCM10009863_23620 [Streptomyces axinellae]|uniref:Secreted protein n=1 Tax=Streptomyces axinellae TaxID=552788 RepID=A0ABP6C9N5_9ACTN
MTQSVLSAHVLAAIPAVGPVTVAARCSPRHCAALPATGTAPPDPAEGPGGLPEPLVVQTRHAQDVQGRDFPPDLAAACGPAVSQPRWWAAHVSFGPLRSGRVRAGPDSLQQT